MQDCISLLESFIFQKVADIDASLVEEGQRRGLPATLAWAAGTVVERTCTLAPVPHASCTMPHGVSGIGRQVIRRRRTGVGVLCCAVCCVLCACAGAGAGAGAAGVWPA